MKINISNSLSKILYVFLSFMVFFYPSSSGGTINSKSSATSIYTYYALCIAVILMIVFQNSINAMRIKLSLFLSLFLFLSTFVGKVILEGRFAIARFLYIFMCLMVFSIDYKTSSSQFFNLIIFKAVSIIMCIWNWCLVFKIPVIAEFTKSTYSQFISYTTRTFVEKGRPIFTFGIYSYCAFFYALMFIIWLYLLESRSENILLCLVIIINLLVFQLLLKSSSGLLLGSVMIYFFLRSMSSKRTGLIISVLFLIGGGLFIYYQNYDWHRLVLGNSSNGFWARYYGTLFADNYVAISETVIGIGYNIIDNMHITYTDSGYIVLATMGGILTPVLVYFVINESMRINIPQRYSLKTFIMFMLFEIALPASLYPKAIMAMALFYITIGSIKSLGQV